MQQAVESAPGSHGRQPLVAGWRRGDIRIWGAIVAISACYFLLGHDFGRSLLADDGFNVPDVEMQEQVEVGQLRNRLGFVGLAAVGGMLLLTFPGNERFRVDNALAVWVLLLLALMPLSITWSIDPEITARRLVSVCCAVLGALGVARAFCPEDICMLAVVFSAIAAATGFFAEWLLGTFVPWQGEYRFAGLVHPNTQAIELTLLVLGSLTLCFEYPRFRAILSGVIVAATLMLLLTKSRTGVAGLAIACGALWLLGSSRREKLDSILIASLALGMLVVVLLTMGFDSPDSIANAMLLGRDEETSTLTGRLPLWTTLLQDIRIRPLLGYGYAAYWNSETLSYLAQELDWAVPNAHNAYLESMLNLGLLGTALWGASVVTAMRSLDRARRLDRCNSLFFSLIVLCLFNGLFESYAIDLFNFVPFITCAGIFRIAFFDTRGCTRQASTIGDESRGTPRHTPAATDLLHDRHPEHVGMD